MPDISIFIPAYNAGAHLEGVIERIPRAVWSVTQSLWIVDDGSTDQTATVIKKLCEKNAKIRSVRFAKNRGYGAAVKAGLAKAQASGADLAVCLHADGQYPPESIPEFLDLARNQGYDILQGSRIASGTALSGGMPVYKFISGKILTFLENRVFGLGMTDYHSGFLCYSRKALNAVNFQALSGSFDFDLEMIAAGRKAGLKIGEVPIPTRYADEISHLNPAAYGMRVLGVMFKYLLGRYDVSLNKG